MASWDLTRERWASLGPSAAVVPGGADALLAAGAGFPVPDEELIEVYLPLCGLLANLSEARRSAAGGVVRDPGVDRRDPPLVVGVAGGVAVGKSTVAGLLAALLRYWPGMGPVEVLSTDAFLYPNRELEARGLMARKGFPETYDWDRLLATLSAVRAGAEEVTVPVYSHRDYDIVPGPGRSIGRPSTLLAEGINVLQSGRPAGPGGSCAMAVSDLLDWSIYVDAEEEDAARWHTGRLLGLRQSGGDRSTGFLGWFCSLSEEEAEAVARASWSQINAVNLREHILPTRARASMILRKGPDHRVWRVSVRDPLVGTDLERTGIRPGGDDQGSRSAGSGHR